MIFGLAAPSQAPFVVTNCLLFFCIMVLCKYNPKNKEAISNQTKERTSGDPPLASLELQGVKINLKSILQLGPSHAFFCAVADLHTSALQVIPPPTPRTDHSIICKHNNPRRILSNITCQRRRGSGQVRWKHLSSLCLRQSWGSFRVFRSTVSTGEGSVKLSQKRTGL